jgi:transcriptional regulator with XRE-family HTH domain
MRLESGQQFSPHLTAQRARERFHQRLKGTFRIVVDTGQLKTVMQVCNLSYRELAKRTGGRISHSTVYHVIQGEHSPNSATVRIITDALLDVLNERYGGELTQNELIELITANTPETRKFDLWGKLANEHRDRHEETGLPANERLAG